MYIETPKYDFCLNPKTGSTSLLSLIYRKYYDPDHTVTFPNSAHYLARCKHTEVPFNPIILIVRHPVNRFLSAMTHMGFDDVDFCIKSIKNKTIIKYKKYYDKKRIIDDPHFRPQFNLIFGETHLFKFKEHFNDVLDLLEIEETIPHLNVANKEKPILTKEQEEFLLEYYKEDLKLFESIDKPNKIIYS